MNKYLAVSTALEMALFPFCCRNSVCCMASSTMHASCMLVKVHKPYCRRVSNAMDRAYREQSPWCVVWQHTTKNQRAHKEGKNQNNTNPHICIIGYSVFHLYSLQP